MHDLVEQRGRRDRLEIERHRRFLDARHLEQVADQREQIFRFPLGVGQHLRLLIRFKRAEVAVDQHLHRREHRRERRLEIVHDHLHEIVAHLLDFAQLAQRVLERVGRRLELEQAAHARAEHEAVVRLGEEVVAAGLDRLDAIGRVVERRDEDDGNALRARIALDAAADLESRRAIVDAEVAGGHRHVEDAEVGTMLEARGERRRSVRGGDGAEAQHVQLIEQQLDVRRDVVGDENQRRIRWWRDGLHDRLMDER